MKQPKLEPCPFCSLALIQTNSTHLVQRLYSLLLPQFCTAQANWHRRFNCRRSFVPVSFKTFVKTSRNEIIGLETSSLPFFAESVRKSSSLPSWAYFSKMALRGGKANYPVSPGSRVLLCLSSTELACGRSVLNVTKCCITQVINFNNSFPSMTKCPSSRLQGAYVTMDKKF